jgi:hypothetical protein
MGSGHTSNSATALPAGLSADVSSVRTLSSRSTSLVRPPKPHGPAPVLSPSAGSPSIWPDAAANNCCWMLLSSRRPDVAAPPCIDLSGLLPARLHWDQRSSTCLSSCCCCSDSCSGDCSARNPDCAGPPASQPGCCRQLLVGAARAVSCACKASSIACRLLCRLPAPSGVVQAAAPCVGGPTSTFTQEGPHS